MGNRAKPMLADWFYSCGRCFLAIGGRAFAMETDKIRDPGFAGRTWTPETIKEAADFINSLVGQPPDLSAENARLRAELAMVARAYLNEFDLETFPPVKRYWFMGPHGPSIYYDDPATAASALWAAIRAAGREEVGGG